MSEQETRTSLLHWEEKKTIRYFSSKRHAQRSNGRVAFHTPLYLDTHVHDSWALFANFHFSLFMMGPPKHFRHRRNTTKITVDFRPGPANCPPEQCRARDKKTKGRPHLLPDDTCPTKPPNHTSGCIPLPSETHIFHLGGVVLSPLVWSLGQQVGRKINEADEAGLAVAQYDENDVPNTLVEHV